MASKKHENAFKLLQKHFAGVSMVKDDGKEYVCVNIKLPKRGGGVYMTLLKKGISKASTYLPGASGAIASFLLLVGIQLADDIVKVAQEMMNNADTDKSTTQIIKETLKKKYTSASVFIKKIITIPIFESILIALAFKKIQEYDPTGISSVLQKSTESTSREIVNAIGRQLLTCPECQAVTAQTGDTEYFTNIAQYNRHVGSHKRLSRQSSRTAEIPEAI